MKYIFSICLLFLLSCNSADNDTDRNLPDPLNENPVEEAIPRDMTIKNDSVVTPVDSILDTSNYIDSPRVNH